MKKVTLLLTLALLVPWLTQSKISKPKTLERVNPQTMYIAPGEKVSGFADFGACGVASSAVTGETANGVSFNFR
jgi:hypothetical protein